MALAVRVAGAELAPTTLEPDDVLAGNPVTSNVVLTGHDTVRYGIWQITPGTSVQVAPTGMFVVVSGRATIAIECGATYDIGPGRCLHLGRGRAHHLDRARDHPQGLVQGNTLNHPNTR